MVDLTAFYTKHTDTIASAIGAIHSREFFAHWPEIPSGKIYGETAMADGEALFRSMLNTKFESLNQHADAWFGNEESPYGFPLGIQYPLVAVDALVARAQAAFPAWQQRTPAMRAGILTEALEAAAKNFFSIAFATMHTTGQGFMMSFQASGPHGFDRALEAVALGYHEQTRFPADMIWEKPMGKMSVKLQKKFRTLGHGVGIVIGCSTFPIWNSFPSIFADLVTGNTVIVKPHPKAILPVAIALADVRRVLAENGVNPDVIQLAVDGERLIAKELAEHPDVRLIDYTGSSRFGEYLETIAGKIVFTEKAGVNSILLDSVENLDAVLENIAFSVALYSGQMCTTPQNIFIPKTGVREMEAMIPYQEVVRRLVEKIDGLVMNEKMGPGTLGAIQNPMTSDRVASVAALGYTVHRKSETIAQPGFEKARSQSPLVVEVPAEKEEVFRKEMFGPLVFVIPTEGTQHSLELASQTTRLAGAITFAAYTTDEAMMEMIEMEMMRVGASVAFNLTGPIWVNQAASYSDFHVTGGNASGNASLVDPSFLTRRYFLVGSRRPVKG